MKPRLAFATLIALYHALVGLILYLDRKKNPEDDSSLNPQDIVLLALASQRISRLITKDKISQPIREPFVEVQGPGLAAELDCKARGDGLQYAIGRLITCPYCLNVWVVTVLGGFLRLYKKPARVILSLFTAVTLSDVWQGFYVKRKQEIK